MPVRKPYKKKHKRFNPFRTPHTEESWDSLAKLIGGKKDSLLLRERLESAKKIMAETISTKIEQDKEQDDE